MNVSVVIPVRDRWHSLGHTLRSLDQQAHPPFEVVVVDDGSALPPPENLRQCMKTCRLHLFRQSSLGIAAARNRGIEISRGDLILFTDSDCILEPNCILEVVKSALNHGKDVAFQMAFVPPIGCLVWRADGIAKSAKQQVLGISSGYIKYLDTAGFAVRRKYVESNYPLFDVAHIRGSDTALLSRLMADGQIPRFVDAAHIEHRPVQGMGANLLKQLRSGYYASPARESLRSSTDVLLPRRGRAAVIVAAWTIAHNHGTGVSSFLYLALSYAVEICGRGLNRIVGMRPGRVDVLGLPLDCLHSSELQCLIVSSAQRRKPSCFTYLTAWSLVQAQANPEFKSILGEFDAVYADGMGVVLAAFLLHLRRVKKVTANDFFVNMCSDICRLNLRVAIVGGTKAVIACTQHRLAYAIPGLHIVLASSGYLTDPQAEALFADISNANSHVIVLAMGQPLQEAMALRIKQTFPRAAILCVGGLFDYIAGINPTPPRPIRSCGFEWLWRFFNAPRRMWKRYLIGIPLLFGYVLRHHILRFLRI